MIGNYKCGTESCFANDCTALLLNLRNQLFKLQINEFPQCHLYYQVN